MKVICLKTKKDFIALLPKDLPSPFTTADLVKTMKVNKALASKIAQFSLFGGVIRTQRFCCSGM